MSPLDLLDHFDRAGSTVGFIATYDFNPEFFERRLLAKRTYGSAERIAIFMDRGRYRDLLNKGLITGGFNSRYLVVPVNRAPFVFHPKLYLALGETRTEAVIGSSNCTNAGIAYNVEICSTFSVSAERAVPSDRDAKWVIRHIFDAIREFAADAGPLRNVLEQEFVAEAEGKVPWLHRDIALSKGDVELLHSYRQPLWTQLRARLEQLRVRSIMIVAPFFDQDLALLRRLRSEWPNARMSLVAQEDYATLPVNKVTNLLAKREDVMLVAEVKLGRRLHAKAFAFDTENGTYWITGSANATTAAFDGRNTEAILWFRTRNTSDELLEHGPFNLRKIDPKTFKAGNEQEPRNEISRMGSPALDSALLEPDGTLDCQAAYVDELAETSRCASATSTKPRLLSLCRSTLIRKANLQFPLTRARSRNSVVPRFAS